MKKDDRSPKSPETTVKPPSPPGLGKGGDEHPPHTHYSERNVVEDDGFYHCEERCVLEENYDGRWGKPGDESPPHWYVRVKTIHGDAHVCYETCTRVAVSGGD